MRVRGSRGLRWLRGGQDCRAVPSAVVTRPAGSSAGGRDEDSRALLGGSLADAVSAILLACVELWGSAGRFSSL